jgi:hypothetical protein
MIEALKVFVRVMEQECFSRAAEQLYVTQFITNIIIFVSTHFNL